VPKSYSPEYIEAIEQVGLYDNLGIALARSCVKANIPLKLVAKFFGVSRMTVHTWFRGGPIRSGRVPLINAFLSIIEEDTAKGKLPLADFSSARQYMYRLIEEKESA
jgi:hypothetical protein